MASTVSTIIAAYNAEKTIAAAVDSALAQSYKENEIVVVDDGSTDSTVSVLRLYSDRIKVITQTNQGAAAARNTGVAHSSGTYLAFLDSDDLWMPGKLSVMLSALERNSEASLAFSEYIKLSDTEFQCGVSTLGHAPSMREIMEQAPPILTSTWVVPRRGFQCIGGFCEAFKGGQGFEDSWTLLLLRELGEFQYIPARLTLYRVNATGESADKYGHALSTFINLAKARYGKQSRTIIRAAKNLQCRWSLSKIAHQMDRGDRYGALCTLIYMARLRPAYFLTAQFTSRLFLPQNVKRLRDLTTARSAKMPR
jgi:glycosyltransferase involved in cell wall biosynthesis